MSLADFLGRLAGRLDAAGIPYMFTGSLASAFHGVVRSTQDVDVVVALDGAMLERLVASLPEDRYYVSDEAARDALRRRSQFNVIDLATGWKADLIVQKTRPFSQEEFCRRERQTVLGVAVWMATAEDTVLSKLEWASKTGSERQLHDAVGIVEVRGATLDRAYIEHWARQLGLLPLWRRTAALAAGPDGDPRG